MRHVLSLHDGLQYCGNGSENASFGRNSKLTRQQLHAAISTLPDKQAKRIYAYCVLGISMAKIAAAEGVSYVAVRSSILRGLRRMGAYLRKENSSFF
ncbi:MAG: hypothetical protein DBY40_04335 [Clostridiales bacterium]|nr:MAG: hypothetical protein DBY40_04335 [Clostridiales bacterium]